MPRILYNPGEHQTLMIGHALDTKRCALWVGMGLGKTSSALSVIEAARLAGETNPVLVLAPKRVARKTWPDEAAKWEHLRDIVVSPVVGSEAQRIAGLRRDANVFTTNYDNLPWLVERLGDRWPFRTVVADEATRLKGFRLKQGGRRAHALGRVAHTKIKRFIELTGTPAPNGLKDLWGQAWYLDAGVRLGRTHEAFKNRWFRPAQDGYGLEPLPFAFEQITDAMRDLCLSLRTEDYFDVEKPIVRDVKVELPSKARQLYREMEKEMFAQIGGHDVEAFNAASRTNKCSQLANGAAYVGDPDAPGPRQWVEVHDAKLQALESIVAEANGMPLLVGYQFKSDLARILKAFPQARELDDDPQTEDDWNAGKIEMLLAHPQSAGHGLNLQYGSNICVLFGLTWNLEHYEQIIERVGPVRQKQAGLNRNTFVYRIVVENTVDEDMIYRCDTKADVQDALKLAMRKRG